MVESFLEDLLDVGAEAVTQPPPPPEHCRHWQIYPHELRRLQGCEQLQVIDSVSEYSIRVDSSSVEQSEQVVVVKSESSLRLKAVRMTTGAVFVDEEHPLRTGDAEPPILVVVPLLRLLLDCC